MHYRVNMVSVSEHFVRGNSERVFSVDSHFKINITSFQTGSFLEAAADLYQNLCVQGAKRLSALRFW